MLKKILKVAWEILEAMIIVYVILITSCILFRNKFGYTEFFEKYTLVTVTDDNQKFVPSHDVGDLLIVKNQKFNINEGDVIYYYATINDEYVVRSGVVKSKTEDEVSALYVLDDEDKTSVSTNRMLGKSVSTHPGKGAILDILESRVGFLFLVLLPILIVFIYQVYQLVVVAKYEVVEEPKEKKTNVGKEEKNEEIETEKEEVSETKEVNEEKKDTAAVEEIDVL